MFGKKSENSGSGKFADKLSIIANGAVFNGDIKTEGNLRIDGKIIGHLNISGNTAIGKTGIVEGDIFASVLKISGTVKGNIEASDKLILDSSAVIEGDVKANILNVEDGAVVNGKIEMHAKPSPESAFRLPESSGSTEKKALPQSTQTGK
ncbi:protein of unknown function DUF583 [Chloroherpeton thalassium ATCC 35110]|uniref:Polymer-forming cytoskeletal protein n=1 Tax=Chloroherpeton thalassium (strain ATCC 35110 / GB-78) TaxID=517418 RepID=B3QZE5_CHLT3|nr:polymer-forming cytoskeletal protein [Chloroherpeton thalassium]ACF13838.1 protein of unknown function DUF583 [Chloroherpeton thalassium ATCC 35110]